MVEQITERGKFGQIVIVWQNRQSRDNNQRSIEQQFEEYFNFSSL